MNSKSFLTAVLVAVSFFALCFVWEMRSALPVGKNYGVTVGACNGFAGAYQYAGCRRNEPRFKQIVEYIEVGGQLHPLNSGCVFLGNVTVCSGENGIVPGLSEGSCSFGTDNCTNGYRPTSYSETEFERTINGEVHIEKNCVPTVHPWTNCGTKISAESC